MNMASTRRSKSFLVTTLSFYYFLTLHNIGYSQAHSPIWTPFPYEAELEYYANNKFIYKSKAMVKNLKYLNVGGELRSNSQVTYRDYSSGIHWHYDIKKRTATPDGSTLTQFLGKEASAKGIEYVMKHYNIPNSYRNLIITAMDNVAASSVSVHYGIPLFRRNLTNAQKQNLPIEIVVGHECYVYTHENQTDRISSKVKSWIEKESGLVLRYQWTTTTRNTLNPRQPSTTNTSNMTVTKFKLHKNIPDSKFQLPPGTIAYYPETMKGLKFPKGVIPKPMTGRTAKSGIDWEEIVAFDKKVRTIPNP